jgi:hypothetical protein
MEDYSIKCMKQTALENDPLRGCSLEGSARMTGRVTGSDRKVSAGTGGISQLQMSKVIVRGDRIISGEEVRDIHSPMILTRTRFFLPPSNSP